jgi:hypothetical protein
VSQPPRDRKHDTGDPQQLDASGQTGRLAPAKAYVDRECQRTDTQGRIDPP